ncbi:sensor histidine kinase [uncultured Treponema sp.]|uniref:sensor histidine kinase n=1 Tax=uncultured Treponema sp. TaxID=162155 RepID=UPI0025F51626|nr:histidine kinase [uncultured Treponema sp.]
MHFSRKVVLVFSLIVFAPLLFLYGATLTLSYIQAIKGLEAICTTEVRMNEEKIYENIQSLKLIDKMIRANGELMLFITSPENREETEVIRTIKEESLTLERILSVEQSMYAIRVFTASDFIPERFPVILHSSRENLAALSPWEFNYEAKYLGFMYAQMLPSACFTQELVNGKRNVGWVQVSMRMEDFFPFLKRALAPYQNDFVFSFDPNSNTLTQINCTSVSTNQTLLSSAEIAQLSKKIARSGTDSMVRISVNGDDTIFACRYLPELGIVISHTCAFSMIRNYNIMMGFFTLFVMIIVSTGFFLLVRYTANRMFRGIYSVMKGMRRVSNGDLTVQIPVDAMDEVKETQKTFNSMIKQLSAQIEQIKNEQHLIADTEMKAMQNQINAHFLYNVLETIHMQAVLAGNEAISQSIMMLGKMMRYCLRWRIHTVTLEKEMEYIQSYVYILNIRNDYEVRLNIEIPEEQQNLKIPKMIIQPFVENSFIHGIEPLGKTTEIRLYTEIDEKNKKIWLCVQDFGKGMSESKINEIRSYLADEKYERDSTGSIGIKNIQQRLTMFYGPDYKLEIHSEPGKGTLIRVPLPIEGDTRQ